MLLGNRLPPSQESYFLKDTWRYSPSFPRVFFCTVINLIIHSGRKPALGRATAHAIQVGVFMSDTLELGSSADQFAHKTFLAGSSKGRVPRGSFALNQGKQRHVSF